MRMTSYGVALIGVDSTAYPSVSGGGANDAVVCTVNCRARSGQTGWTLRPKYLRSPDEEQTHPSELGTGQAPRCERSSCARESKAGDTTNEMVAAEAKPAKRLAPQVACAVVPHATACRGNTRIHCVRRVLSCNLARAWHSTQHTKAAAGNRYWPASSAHNLQPPLAKKWAGPSPKPVGDLERSQVPSCSHGRPGPDSLMSPRTLAIGNPAALAMLGPATKTCIEGFG